MEIVERGPITVIGLPVKAKWRELWIEMPIAWREFFARHIEIGYQEGDAFVDVSLDKVDDEYLQLVCSQVTRVGKVPDGMRAIEIPAQRYVHHRHVGPVESIAESFGRMYDWAREQGHPANEFKLDFGYTIEGDELEHDLYVGLHPIKQWRDLKAV